MAHHVRHDREGAAPFPLRRVVRQRPLTEAELAAMYGTTAPHAYTPDVSPPGVVRPAEWTDDVAGDPRSAAPYPPTVAEPWPMPEPWIEPREPVSERYAELDEEPLVVPMRRSRITWPLVGAVVIAAAALLGYALVRSDLLDGVRFGEPAVSIVEEQAPVAREAVALEPSSVIVSGAMAEPNVAIPGEAEADTEEPAPAARTRRPQPNRTYTYQRPTAPAARAPEATSPYPNLEDDRSLDRLEEEVERGLDAPPRAAPKPPEPPPAAPSDLKVPEQYRKRAPAEDIVRDPGF